MVGCLQCVAALSRSYSGGGYSMRCVWCCARLVRSARPLKHAQEAHLAVAARYGHSLESVLVALRALDARLADKS